MCGGREGERVGQVVDDRFVLSMVVVFLVTLYGQRIFIGMPSSFYFQNDAQ